MPIRVEVQSGHAAGDKYDFETGPVLIGRGRECQVRLHPLRDTRVASSVHARLLNEGDAWWVECLHDAGVTAASGPRAVQVLKNGERAPVVGAIELELSTGGPRLSVLVPLPERVTELLAHPRVIEAILKAAKRKARRFREQGVDIGTATVGGEGQDYVVERALLGKIESITEACRAANQGVKWRGGDAGRSRRREQARRQPAEQLRVGSKPQKLQIAAFASIEQWMKVQAALGRLSELQLRILREHYFDERSFRQIARGLGMTEAAARSQHHRAVILLRESTEAFEDKVSG